MNVERPPPLRDLHIVRELGSGTHGTVHEATLTRDRFGHAAGGRVAVKFLRQEYSGDKRWIARFRREAEIGSRIDHPNVVRILRLEETEMLGLPLVYLVMEFVEGRTLRDLIDTGGPAVEALVRRVGADVARGLQALHERNIVHRDIKPENLHLADDGMTKIVDLGLAQRVPARGSKGSGAVAGTLLYTAPELLRGRRARAATDLYALGIVLFELATGEHPFAAWATSADRMIEAHQEAEVPAPSALQPRLSPLLDRVVRSLLAKRPRDRIRNAGELAAILSEGESSAWWRRHRRKAPLLESEQRLRNTRRPARAALVGRERELRVLDDALARAMLGEPGIVHVRGPEGAGKRRLVDEFVAAHLRADDGIVYFAGEPASSTQDQPLSPLGWFLVEAYTGEAPRYAADRPPASREGSAERLATRLCSCGLSRELAAVLAGFLLTGRISDPEPVVAAAARALAALGTERRPVVFRIHRADALDTASRSVLTRLARESPAHVLTILCSHADRSVPEIGGPARQTIEIGPLDAAAARALCGHLFRSPDEAGRAARWLGEHLTPVPGWILDSLAVLASRGELQGRPGDYHGLDESAALPIDARLETFLQLAWQHLTPDQRELLEAAAVLGQHYRAADLARMLETDELDTLARVSALPEGWVLTDRLVARFRRRSQRHLIVAWIPPERRRVLHEQAARILEDRGARPLKIAMHLSRAGLQAQALPRLLDATETFLRRASAARARLLLQRCDRHLRALGSDADPRQAARAELAHADLELLSGHPDEAERRLRALFEENANLDAELQARCLMGLARAARDLGFILRGLDAVERCVALLPESADEARVRAELMLAELQNVGGRLREGLRTAAAIHARLVAAGDTTSPLYAKVTMELARLESGRLRMARATRQFAEAERLFRLYDDALSLARLDLRRARLQIDLGETAAARDRLQDLELPSPRERARRHQLIGMSLHYEGRYAAALDAFDAAAALAREARDAFGGAGIRVTRMETLAELGRPDARELTTILDDAVAGGLVRAELTALRLSARAAREAGDLPAARTALDRAAARLRRVSVEPTFLPALRLEESRLLEAEGRTEAAGRARVAARRQLQRLATRLGDRRARRRFLHANPTRRALWTV